MRSESREEGPRVEVREDVPLTGDGPSKAGAGGSTGRAQGEDIRMVFAAWSTCRIRALGREEM